ncbi:MAG: tRNA (N(6)-L-threonylcarbamoyladenosine(37)-C(2))-methylthiotransferase MtaB [Ruminococcaceae bacterium]|nr:tRNA (N(6)-L-threonylcarbamoyladenosine(37)-C(2))-methylthiotransferase MtaB [Oscillospiraceae bacterium]
MDSVKTFYIYTLGCKVNRYESEAMAALLSESGRYAAISDKDKYRADVFVLNSCIVTEESEKKAFKIIRRYRRENPDGTLVFCGCMPQALYEKSKTAEADVLFGNKERGRLFELLDKYFADGRQQIDAFEKHTPDDKFEILAPKSYESLTRANLKIEDGCNRYCAYCLIPFARGPVRSMPLAEIRKQASTLVAEGHREIVITGINLCMYGTDIKSSLKEAVEAVLESGVERVRLGSLEADIIDDELLDYLAGVPQFCPQFHISMQSGSDTVLKRMNRHYTVSEYEALVRKIKAKFDNPTITTDIIVGFEGETEKEFSDSCETAKMIGFTKIHIFPYSVRQGTKAAESKNQLAPEIKRQRALRLFEIGENIKKDFYESQKETVHSVLFEKFDGMYNCGHTKNFMYVKVLSDKSMENEIADVKITDFDDEECYGSLI